MPRFMIAAALARLVLAAVATAAALPAMAQSEGAWTSRAPLPAGVAEVDVAELDGQVYVVGGTEQVGEGELDWASTLVLRYDPTLDAWDERAPLPYELSHVGLAAFGGRLYAIGGFTNVAHLHPQTVALAYDPAADAWSELPPLPVTLGSVAVAAVDGRLHVLGGRDGAEVVEIPMPPGEPPLFSSLGTVNSHLVLDPATREWSEAAPVPGPSRDHVGVAVLDGRVHLFGGRFESFSDNLDRHDEYDPAIDSWSVAAPLPTPRSSGAFTVLDGRILYAGGECKPDGEPFSPNTFTHVTAYHPETDSWSTLVPLPQGRHAFSAATVGDVAFFAGGATVCGGGATTDLLALTLG